MLTVLETTAWENEAAQNHKYIVSGRMDICYGYIKHGDRLPYLFKNPIKIDWRGRTYKVLVKTKDVKTPKE